jgi:hypothetical protein
MMAALFILRATNSSLVFASSLYTSLSIHPHRQKSDLNPPNSNSCISTPAGNWTHVYMNLFTGNCPYSHLPKYLLFLLKHPVYLYIHISHYVTNAPTSIGVSAPNSGSFDIAFAKVTKYEIMR